MTTDAEDIAPPLAGTPPGALKRPGFLVFLAVLDLLGGGACLLAALGLAAAGTRGGGPVPLVLGGLAAALGAAQLLCVIGLFTLAPWSRRLQMVASMAWLPFFPLGTVAGAAVLIYLTRPGARLVLGRLTEEELDADDRAALARLPKAGTTATIAVAVTVMLSVVAVPFLGIVSAIAIPNLLSAINRAKQKRTMADVRAIAVGLEAYASDHRQYPDASDLDSLEAVLVPDYVARLPRQDGWLHPLKAVAWSDDGEGPGYVIASAGKDGVWDRPMLTQYEPAETEHFDADIVFANGAFVQAPAAVLGAGLGDSSPVVLGGEPAEVAGAPGGTVEPEAEAAGPSEVPDSTVAQADLPAPPEPGDAGDASTGGSPPAATMLVPDRDRYMEYTIRTTDGGEITVDWFERKDGRVLITKRGGEFAIAESEIAAIDGRLQDGIPVMPDPQPRRDARKEKTTGR